jgi:CheY-like chemotaxis protein
MFTEPNEFVAELPRDHARETLALLDAIRAGEGIAGRIDPDTPLIVLSRHADRLQRIRVLECGGDDIVRKPSRNPSCVPGSRRYCGARRSGAQASCRARARS